MPTGSTCNRPLLEPLELPLSLTGGTNHHSLRHLLRFLPYCFSYSCAVATAAAAIAAARPPDPSNNKRRLLKHSPVSVYRAACATTPKHRRYSCLTRRLRSRGHVRVPNSQMSGITLKSHDKTTSSKYKQTISRDRTGQNST